MLRLRTLSITLILALLLQLWITGASYAAISGLSKVSTYPTDNDPSVPANALLRLKFDENVFKGSGGTVSIKDSSTNVAAVSYNVTDSHITVDPSATDTIIIDPAGSLLADHSYYVEISPNTFFNEAGTGYEGISDAISWNFGVIANDNTPPSATFDPLSGGTIATTAPLKLTFNEKVFANTGSIRIIRNDTNDTQVIPVLSSAVTGSGLTNGAGQTMITIQPPTRLVSGKSYSVQIDGTAFVDVVGNAYTHQPWTFSTTPPAVVLTSTTPVDNNNLVSPGSALTAQMDFAVNMVKGSTGLIQLKKILDNSIVDTINMAVQADAARVTVTGSTVNIAFNGTLLPNTGYYILMDPGVLKDTLGNSFEGFVDAASWNFTTIAGADSVAPTLLSFSPSTGSTMTAVNGELALKFNEPVKPGSGNIVIRHKEGAQSVFCSIPVTSGAVVGGGTDKITIKPSSYSCGNFVKQTKYAVQMGSMAITDMSGNSYTGIPTNDFSSWWFQITSDSVQPELISTTPAPGSNSVKTSGVTFTMTFSEDIAAPSGSATLIPQGGGTAVAAVLTRDSVDYRKVKFTPAGLAAATTYVVNIPNNAITDLAGNPFPGILNDYRWTFKTIGSDLTAPLFLSAAMDGNSVVLTYNEDLDDTSVPYAANFYVTVNDVPRQVNAVAIIGNTVRLTLHSGVAVGQSVKVSYTVDNAPGHNKLQDLSGNDAVLLNAKDVTNTTDTTLARPLSGILSGNTLTLTFNKQLAAVSNSAASQFIVKLNGAAQGVSAVSVSGTTVFLTLPTSATNIQSVSVTYGPGSTPLRDLSGNAVAGFTDFYVQNTNDTQPPQLASAAALGTKVTLNFNEGIKATPLPSKSNFSVLVNGTAAVISAVAVNNNTVELTLAQAIPSNAVILISYIPGSTGIKDLAGNGAAAINSHQVVAGTVNSAKFSSATVKGTDLVLTYTAALNASSLPYSSQYFVKVDGLYNGVTGVSASGTQVTLKLTTPVKAEQRVTLTYVTSGVPLKDAQNQPVEPINETVVTNQSSLLDGIPDYLESDGEGGLRFVNAKASTAVLASTPSGRPANRYMLSGDKVLVAYDLIGSGKGIQVPQVTFKVPSTEAGALVGIPVRSLMDSAARASNNASFRLDFGDLQFTLPLRAINFNKQLQLAGGDVSTAYLLLNIERTSNTPLVSIASGRGAQTLTTPANFTASILSGGREREIDSYEMNVKRTFVLASTGGAASNEISVVRLDNDSGEISYVPTTIENSNGGVKVNFLRKGNSVYAVIRKNTTFTDMSRHWADGDVSILASKFIVDGPTLTSFAPNKNITRSDFAEYIARGLGLNGDRSSAARFRDVGVGHSAASYIGAVSNAGIVEGGSDGKFRPDASITREEMATILVRAMKYADVQTSAPSSALNRFKDRSKVSGWAKEGMSICVTVGLIKGSPKNEISPKSNASRAEAAVMIKRFLEYLDFL